MGSPVGDVNSQNYLSFQQPLKRTPPGPFPRGVTSPLSRQDEPGGGQERAAIRGQVTGGHDVRAAPQSPCWPGGEGAAAPSVPSPPSSEPGSVCLSLKPCVDGGREPGLLFLLSPLGTVPFLQLSLQGLFAEEGSQEPLDGQGYRCLD